MTTIIWPSDTKEVIDSIRGAIGRDVTFWNVVSQEACEICSLDPVTNLSTDAFCPVCSGFYWISVYSGYTTSAHITWNPAETLTWNTGGQQFDGDCRIQIEYSEQIATIVDQAEYVIVDNKTLEIENKIYRGVQPLNRIILNLMLKEK